MLSGMGGNPERHTTIRGERTQFGNPIWKREGFRHLSAETKKDPHLSGDTEGGEATLSRRDSIGDTLFYPANYFKRKGRRGLEMKISYSLRHKI